MTDSELFEFVDLFKHLRRVFPLRGEEHEMTEVARSYFKALRRFSLSDVRAGCDAWIARGERFPKPGQWISSIPRRVSQVQFRTLTDVEARERLHAETEHWERPSCSCDACVDANISHMPLRYVPDVDENDSDLRANCPIRQKLVTTGHWAHGTELRRWYDAKANFFMQFNAALKQRSLT